MSETPADSPTDSPTDSPIDSWYFDLERQIAVPARERGLADHMLGPYRTKGEAENWRATVEARNEAWDEADQEWEGDDEPATDD